MNKLIYLDNAATTQCYKEVAELVCEQSQSNYFNPSALYKPSVEAQIKLEEARKTIKNALHAPDGELYFTSGGSESDNTAFFCTRKPKGSRIVTSLGEHDAVVNTANELKNQGYDVQFAPVNKDGSVNFEEFKKLLNEDVSFVSIMHVSNETGAINDIAKFVKATRRLAPNAVFHSDGVQAFEKVKVNLRSLDVDLYSVSAHKIHGPKGIGGLFVKKGTSMKPLIFGGGQEKGFRSGTENLPAILGFAKAVELNEEHFEENISKKHEFKEYLAAKLNENIDDLVFVSPKENCAPNILTVAFKDVRGEVLLHSIEEDGILVGIGSACSSHRESRFKSLLGLDEAHKDGIIRFSTSEFSDIDDVDFIVELIKRRYEVLKNYKRV